jgi:hypothetical protein
MSKRIAVFVGVLGTWPASAFAQFSTPPPDLTAGGGAATTTAASQDVEGTGHPGKFGLGLSSHARGTARNIASVLPAAETGGAAPALTGLALGSVSAKYFVTDRIALELLLGFGWIKSSYFPNPFDRNNEVKTSGVLFSIGPRALYSAIRGENSELYLGGGLDVVMENRTADPEGPDNALGWDASAYIVYVPVGFEFGFPGAPAVRLSAEMAVSFVSASYTFHQDTGADVREEEAGSATAVILGSPGLDFISLGLHYYF